MRNNAVCAQKVFAVQWNPVTSDCAAGLIENALRGIHDIKSTVDKGATGYTLLFAVIFLTRTYDYDT
jgi:hypothetical protein